MKTYLEISISANKNQQELLIPTMVELGCHGFADTDTELLCYIDKSLWTDEKFELLKSDLNSLLRVISSNSVIKVKEIEEENWNEQWEKSIDKLEIGNRIIIKPTWVNYGNTDNRIVIQIDPKMSFGTGHHETTKLTLQLLEKYIFEGATVLDVGTGTGILAIAALKLGAKEALAIDNDEWSILNAKENVNANDLEDRIVVTDTQLNLLNETEYDIITANIMLTTIIELLPETVKRLKESGKILFSGLLLQDEEAFREAIEKYQLRILEIIYEGEWIAAAASRV
jgi:ribosomal protein L11 methyltransferase